MSWKVYRYIPYTTKYDTFVVKKYVRFWEWCVATGPSYMLTNLDLCSIYFFDYGKKFSTACNHAHQNVITILHTTREEVYFYLWKYTTDRRLHSNLIFLTNYCHCEKQFKSQPNGVGITWFISSFRPASSD